MYVNSPSSVTFRLLARCTQASDTPQDSPPSLTIWHRSCTPSLQRHSSLTADSTFVASCTRGRQRLGNLDASESIVAIRSPNWSTHPPADCSSRIEEGLPTAGFKNQVLTECLE